MLWQRAVVPSCLAVLSFCAPSARYHAPSQPRDYQIVITHQDSLSRAIGRGLKRKGYRIRTAVKGGSGPSAYLLSFTQREAGPTSPLWLYVRLADTRTGAIVAAVSAPIDSLGATPDVRAQAIVDSLTGTSAGLRSPPLTRGDHQERIPRCRLALISAEC